MTVDDIKDAISVLFNFHVVEEDDAKVVFRIVSDKTAILDKNQIQDIISNLPISAEEQEVELFSNNYYEVLVRNERRIFIGRQIEQRDTINKLEYNLSKPTNEYLMFFLYNLNKQNTPRILRGVVVAHRIRRIFEKPPSNQLPLIDWNIIELIKEIVPGLETIQIKSENNKRKSEYEQLLYAFLFNLGYNLDYTILPLRFMAEFIQPFRISRMRRATSSEVEYPKRLYINELILHYQKGISSESIDHQYLSFYHVLEHFFEKIYNDDILQRIRNELTKPNFSYKRNKDINGLINLIQNRLKYKNDEFLINEPEALELTLKEFIIDTDLLKTELFNISPELIEYYKTTEVSFSKGNRVNFDIENREEIIKNLSKRIYATRNSIVHSKETEKSKYTPFKDDKDLLNEIYLMRLIAEIVIIQNSQEL